MRSLLLLLVLFCGCAYQTPKHGGNFIVKTMIPTPLGGYCQYRTKHVYRANSYSVEFETEAGLTVSATAPFVIEELP